MRGIRPPSPLVLALWLAGCAAGAPAPTPSAAPPLLATVQVGTFPDSVHFVLQVTNTTDRPIELAFGSGQSFDFAVRRGDRELWRWSADRMFTQALRSETLAPGDTKRYDAGWIPGAGASGEYTVTGTLTDREYRVAQSATFRLP
jgi:hypothetical protein